MTSVAQVIKSVGPKLVPFFKTVAIYFVVFIPHNQPSFMGMILKCLPIASLIIFILLHGMSTGSEHQYSRLIIAGMFFCLIGDAFLIWPGYFDFGVLSFLIGHLIYIRALGFQPLKLPLGIFCYIVSILGTLYFLPDVEGHLKIGVAVYSLVLMTMVWRVTARVQFSEDLWTWSKLCTCAGGISFAISDLLVGIEHFKGGLDYGQVLIMTTYYAAQLGLSLSVIDAKLESSLKQAKKQDCVTKASKSSKHKRDKAHIKAN